MRHTFPTSIRGSCVHRSDCITTSTDSQNCKSFSASYLSELRSEPLEFALLYVRSALNRTDVLLASMLAHTHSHVDIRQRSECYTSWCSHSRWHSRPSQIAADRHPSPPCPHRCAHVQERSHRQDRCWQIACWECQQQPGPPSGTPVLLHCTTPLRNGSCLRRMISWPPVQQHHESACRARKY